MHYCKEPLSHVLDLGRVEAPKELGEDRTQQSTAAAETRKTSCHVTKETMKRVGQAPDALMTARKGN